MSTNPAIYCVGIIGKENEPIYIESFSTDDNADTTLKHQYQVHYSLDVIEERLATSNKLTPITDLYLGLLLTLESRKIYGYITNTRIKFVVIAREGLNDVQVKAFFKDLHSQYTNAVCNPFSQLSAKLDSPSFSAAVHKLVGQVKPVPQPQQQQ